MPYRRRGFGRSRVYKYTGGRKKAYVNLKVFNSECPSRGVRGNLCELKAVHRAKDGSCIATMKSSKGLDALGGKPGGTWRIRWASCEVMRMKLGRRITDPKALIVSGANPKRKR